MARSTNKDDVSSSEPVINISRTGTLEQEQAPAQAGNEKLELTVKVDSPGACQRHITVTISEKDIDRYFNKSIKELMPTATVPGFRPGHVPRKLVETRFRKELSDQVKGSLVMDSIAQVTEDQKLSAISEPDLNMDAVALPESGPMTYEFKLEVRPEFELPNWKKLKIERPVHEFTEKDVDNQLQQLLTRYGKLIPHDGKASLGDYVVCNLTFKDGDEIISSSKEETIRIRPVLSFRDGRVEKFDKLLKGVQAGETKEGQAEISKDAPNEKLRGKTVSALFEILEVKKLELPETTPEFLEQLGGFASMEALRDYIKNTLKRRLEYQQNQKAREQVLAALTVAADWELPPDLLRRQARRELERQIMELQRSGFNDQEILTHENQLRQNSLAATSRALKEHFILERLAEEEKIEDSPQDYNDEIALIAAQSNESPRRIRSRLEKRGSMDILRNQIIERKAVDLILDHAIFTDVPFEPENQDSEAIDQSMGGDDEGGDIPDVKEAGSPDKSE